MDNDDHNLSWIDIGTALDIMGEAADTFRKKAINYKYSKDKLIDEWYKACSCGVKPISMENLSSIIGAEWIKNTYENKITVFTHMHPNYRNIGHNETTCMYCQHTEILIHLKRRIPYREVNKDGSDT